jgi:hypothetical protein
VSCTAMGCRGCAIGQASAVKEQARTRKPQLMTSISDWLSTALLSLQILPLLTRRARQMYIRIHDFDIGATFWLLSANVLPWCPLGFPHRWFQTPTRCRGIVHEQVIFQVIRWRSQRLEPIHVSHESTDTSFRVWGLASSRSQKVRVQCQV